MDKLQSIRQVATLSGVIIIIIIIIIMLPNQAIASTQLSGVSGSSNLRQVATLSGSSTHEQLMQSTQ
jgi:hypothetical protein